MPLSSQRRETLKDQFERLRRKLFERAPRQIKVSDLKVDLERRQMFVRAEQSRDRIR